MMSAAPAWLTFGIGFATALGFLAYIGKTPRKWRWALVVGVVAQLTVLTVQFVRSEDLLNHQRDTERNRAAFLFLLFNEKKPLGGLQDEVLKQEPYALAYKHFRTKEFDKAEVEFKDLIKNKQYVAQSNYLLGEIAREAEAKKPRPDYSLALTYLDEAIKADDKYSSPLYMRAVLTVPVRELAAFQDLRKAASQDKGLCILINQQGEVKDRWASVASNPSFLAVQRECKLEHKII